MTTNNINVSCRLIALDYQNTEEFFEDSNRTPNPDLFSSPSLICFYPSPELSKLSWKKGNEKNLSSWPKCDNERHSLTYTYCVAVQKMLRLHYLTVIEHKKSTAQILFGVFTLVSCVLSNLKRMILLTDS